jgi:hypothetical protein
MSFFCPRWNDIGARRPGDQEALWQPASAGVRGRDPLTGRKRWLSRQVRGHTKESNRQAKKVEATQLIAGGVDCAPSRAAPGMPTGT